MNDKKFKLFSLNAGLLLIDFIMGMLMVYTNEYVSSDGAETLLKTFAIGVIILSVFAFGYGNYKILTGMAKEPQRRYHYVLDEIDTPEECYDALNKLKKKTFQAEVTQAVDQVRRMERKKDSLKQILYQKCEASGQDLMGMQGVVEEAEQLMYENIRHMLSRMAIFDEEGYEQLMRQSGTVGQATLQQRKNIYYEHISYVRQQIEKNETILIEYDHLLTEISKMGDEEQEDSAGIAHMRDVIQGMKQLNVNADQELEQLQKKYEGGNV